MFDPPQAHLHLHHVQLQKEHHTCLFLQVALMMIFSCHTCGMRLPSQKWTVCQGPDVCTMLRGPFFDLPSASLTTLRRSGTQALFDQCFGRRTSWAWPISPAEGLPARYSRCYTPAGSPVSRLRSVARPSSSSEPTPRASRVRKVEGDQERLRDLIDLIGPVTCGA